VAAATLEVSVGDSGSFTGRLCWTVMRCSSDGHTFCPECTLFLSSTFHVDKSIHGNREIVQYKIVNKWYSLKIIHTIVIITFIFHLG
jgi:hypothetical protein